MRFSKKGMEAKTLVVLMISIVLLFLFIMYVAGIWSFTP